jgi:hypothetical protein
LEFTNRSPGPPPLSSSSPSTCSSALLPTTGSASPLAAALPPPLPHLLLDQLPRVVLSLPSPLSPPRCPHLRAPRLPGPLLGRHLAVAVESSLQHAKALSFVRNSTIKAPTFRSPGSSANSRTPTSISTAASSSSTPAAPAHRGQPRSTAHCSHRPPNQLLRPLLELLSPQPPSNFGRSTVADDHRPPPPPAHLGQAASAIPAP